MGIYQFKFAITKKLDADKEVIKTERRKTTAGVGPDYPIAKHLIKDNVLEAHQRVRMVFTFLCSFLYLWFLPSKYYSIISLAWFLPFTNAISKSKKLCREYC